MKTSQSFLGSGFLFLMLFLSFRVSRRVPLFYNLFSTLWVANYGYTFISDQLSGIYLLAIFASTCFHNFIIIHSSLFNVQALDTGLSVLL